VLVAVTWASAHRLVISSVLAVLVTVGCFAACMRPKSPRPLTWAAAMLGAVGAFGAMILVYGVVPDEWMQFADAELGWSQSAIWQKVGPITINKRALKDTVAVIIYVVFFGAQIALAVMWQKRPTAEAAAAAKAAAVESGAARPAGFSRFGRPLSRKA
jgi:preprotein translocase subunit SecE